MLRLLIFFLLLATLSLTGAWLLDNDGPVSITWLGYRIDTTVMTLLTAVFLLLLTAIFCTRFLFWITHLPERISLRRAGGKQNQALTALTEGFTAIAAGDVDHAKRATSKATKLLGNQPLALMLAAETARLQGNEKLTKQRYTALLENKTTAFAGLKGLLQQARRQGDMQKALELAEEAYHNNTDATWLPPILLELYQYHNRWDDIATLLKRLNPKHYPDIDIAHLTAIAQYMQARMHYEKAAYGEAYTLLSAAHKALPEFVPITILYVQTTLKLQKTRRSKTILKEAWRHTPHPDLTDSFFDLHAEVKPKTLLTYAEKLANGNPSDPESHILLARASIVAERYNKARNHLKQAMEHRETASLFELMAKIETSGPEPDPAEAAQWRDKAKQASPDPSWVCQQCHTVHDAWQPVCRHCHSYLEIAWVTPTLAPEKLPHADAA